MSSPNGPEDLFSNPNPSGDFGRDEGVSAYFMVVAEHPDWTVERIARHAVHLQMIVSGRFDVHDTLASLAVVEELDLGFETDGEE